MTNFTVALNEVLERMKTARGLTRQEFAKSIGMPNSTLASYYNGTNQPTRQALADIADGLEETEAQRLILAHLCDETPEAWRDRLAVSGAKLVAEDSGIALSRYDLLPPDFLRQIESILREAKRNKHVIAFVREFAACLGLTKETGAEWQNPPEEKLGAQPKAPASGVLTTDSRGPSTPAAPPREVTYPKRSRKRPG